MANVPHASPRALTAVCVLAAGTSSRMGSHKLLLPLADRPLIYWSVSAACASRAADILVILGRDAESVQAALPDRRQVTIVNERANLGQSTSLVLAVASVAESAPGLVVTLADQPFMDAGSINRVLAAAEAEPDRIAMGGGAGHLGHPVYLPRRLFPDMSELQGDTGARDIIRRERSRVTRIPLDNVYAQFDVDTPEDYARAMELSALLRSP